MPTVETYGLEDESVRVSLSVQVTPDCPIKDEVDEYLVTVSWTTDGETFEKWGLQNLLHGYNGMTVCQETLCEAIYRELPDADVSDLSVEVQDTRHMDMVVTKP